jgi:hypothetical protein
MNNTAIVAEGCSFDWGTDGLQINDFNFKAAKVCNYLPHAHKVMRFYHFLCAGTIHWRHWGCGEWKN